METQELTKQERKAIRRQTREEQQREKERLEEQANEIIRLAKIQRASNSAGIPDHAITSGKTEPREGKNKGDIRFTSNISEPLQMYKNRKQITVMQFDAGNKLYADFYIAGMQCINATTLDRTGGLSEFSEKQLEARQRWRNAVDAVQGAIGKLLVINVCCYGESVGAIENRYYTHANAAMSRFREAMDDLAGHYYPKKNLLDEEDYA